MKIDVQKTERKTLFGSTRYNVFAKIELAPDEQDFAKRRKIDCVFFDSDRMEGLLQERYVDWVNKNHGLRLKSYLRGANMEFNTLAQADNYEAALMDALKETKNQLLAQQDSEKELGQKRSYEI